MSDARSLLRAHRAANRIEHPHAAYSDAGKLLCKLCHEAVKSESLWDGHLRSAAHRQKLTALQERQQQEQPQSSSRPAAAPTETNTTTTTINHKRKHGIDEDDIDMDDSADGLTGAGGEDAASRKKKNRTDSTGTGGERASNTPPSLTRRTSNAPEKGVGIAIPSRPATPLLDAGSANSTPRLPSHGRSPLIGSGSEHSNSTPNTSHGRAPTSAPDSAAATATTTNTTTTAPAAGKSVDEAEWALFEAEIADTAEPTPPPPESLPNPRGAAGVISAPALTADQIAAKSQEEENERRKLRFDAEMADEREDATRALEDEFDEMEELEARVRKLKEKREELRKGSMVNLRAAATTGPKTAKTLAAGGKENGGIAEDSEEDDEEDEEEDFDDGFRFRV
ncbi:hypothetical protein PG994_002595 [Apiospora phragmitis]|uniref:Coiled-coil domain-containing protein 16 n=1 Tax=Apiospora phragmitis TaxID=2905665 RepID=A0ABR1W5Q9_9PEZI